MYTGKTNYIMYDVAVLLLTLALGNSEPLPGPVCPRHCWFEIAYELERPCTSYVAAGYVLEHCCFLKPWRGGESFKKKYTYAILFKRLVSCW